MTISYFTRFYRALLSLLCRYFPVLFARIVCGRLVYVSKFPTRVLGYSEPAGWYFVESFCFDHTGAMQLFLEVELGSIEDFSLIDLEVTAIGINTSRMVSTIKAVRNSEAAPSLVS